MFLAFSIVDIENVKNIQVQLEIGCGYMHEQTNMIENIFISLSMTMTMQIFNLNVLEKNEIELK